MRTHVADERNTRALRPTTVYEHRGGGATIEAGSIRPGARVSVCARFVGERLPVADCVRVEADPTR